MKELWVHFIFNGSCAAFQWADPAGQLQNKIYPVSSTLQREVRAIFQAEASRKSYYLIMQPSKAKLQDKRHIRNMKQNCARA